MKTILGLLMVGGLSFAAGAWAHGSAPSLSPMISTNEGGCSDKCKTCEQKCGDDNKCKDGCWSAGDSCCSGVGGKGVYKMCGCKDK